MTDTPPGEDLFNDMSNNPPLGSLWGGPGGSLTGGRLSPFSEFIDQSMVDDPAESEPEEEIELPWFLQPWCYPLEDPVEEYERVRDLFIARYGVYNSADRHDYLFVVRDHWVPCWIYGLVMVMLCKYDFTDEGGPHRLLEWLWSKGIALTYDTIGAVTADWNLIPAEMRAGWARLEIQIPVPIPAEFNVELLTSVTAPASSLPYLPCDTPDRPLFFGDEPEGTYSERMLRAAMNRSGMLRLNELPTIDPVLLQNSTQDLDQDQAKPPSQGRDRSRSPTRSDPPIRVRPPLQLRSPVQLAGPSVPTSSATQPQARVNAKPKARSRSDTRARPKRTGRGSTSYRATLANATQPEIEDFIANWQPGMHVPETIPGRGFPCSIPGCNGLTKFKRGIRRHYINVHGWSPARVPSIDELPVPAFYYQTGARGYRWKDSPDPSSSDEVNDEDEGDN